MLFSWEKETKAVKDRILRNIKNLFEHEEKENHYKLIAYVIFRTQNYIEYEVNGDGTKALSAEEYLSKPRPYLKDIINNIKMFHWWKIQLLVANNDDECVMHSKGDNMVVKINDYVKENIKELFDSLKNRYQNNLESMKGSDFVFGCVQLLY